MAVNIFKLLKNIFWHFHNNRFWRMAHNTIASKQHFQSSSKEMASMSYYLKNHKVLQVPRWQRQLFLGMSQVLLSPLRWSLDATGIYLNMHRKMQSHFPMNDLLRPAFDDYQPTEHDVIVTTYPKSGTYWMLQIAYQIGHHGQGDYEHIHDVVPWPDGKPSVEAIPLEDTQAQQASPEGLRIIKTHLAWGGFPYNEDAKYIGILRDPKEVVISSYFFVKDVGFGAMMPAFNTWLELFLSPDFLLGSWAQHTASLWAERERDNFLLVTYHDMQADGTNIIQQVAGFLGVTLDDEAFSRVQERSGFDYMKRHDDKFHPGPGAVIAPATGNIIRKGKSNNSREMLNREQQRRIDAYMQAELARLGCDLPYGDLFHVAD
jgi:hypothetical protein